MKNLSLRVLNIHALLALVSLLGLTVKVTALETDNGNEINVMGDLMDIGEEIIDIGQFSWCVISNIPKISLSQGMNMYNLVTKCAQKHDASRSETKLMIKKATGIYNFFTGGNGSTKDQIESYLKREIKMLAKSKTLAEVRDGLNDVEDFALALLEDIDPDTSLEELNNTLENIKNQIENVFETMLDDGNKDFSIDGLTIDEFQHEINDFIHGDQSTRRKLELAYRGALDRINEYEDASFMEKHFPDAIKFIRKLKNKIVHFFGKKKENKEEL